jgi:hypothetical protein
VRPPPRPPPRPSPLVLPILVALAPVLLALAPASVPGARAAIAPGEPALPCRTLAVVARGGGGLVLLGERAGDDDPGPVAVAAGCGAGDPSWTEAWAGTADGAWSGSAIGAAGLRGLVIPWRDGLLAARRGDAGPRAWPAILLLPAAAEWGLPGVRVDRLRDGIAFAVAVHDPWTFALVEQSPEGGLLERVLVVEGPGPELVTSRQRPLDTGWPPGVALLPPAASAGALLVAGRRPGGADVRVLLATERGTETLPTLQIAQEAVAVAAWLGERPALLVVGGGRARAHLLEGGEWRPGPDRESLPPGAAPPLAAAATRRNGRALLAVLAGERLVVHDVGADGTVGEARALERAPERATAPAPIELPPQAPWIAAGLALVVAALLLLRTRAPSPFSEKRGRSPFSEKDRRAGGGGSSPP